MALPGHIGRPEELARALLFLASDASRCVTSQPVVVDGGVTVSIGALPLTDALFSLLKQGVLGGLGKRIMPA